MLRVMGHALRHGNYDNLCRALSHGHASYNSDVKMMLHVITMLSAIAIPCNAQNLSQKSKRASMKCTNKPL